MQKFSKIFLVLSISLSLLAGYGGFSSSLLIAQARVYNTLSFFIDPFDYTRSRQFYKREFEEEIYNELRSWLPEGVKDLGYFGFSPYPMLSKSFNYKMLPVYTSFAASTPTLSRFNVSEFDKLPEYLLVNYVTIDERYLFQDDSMQQLYIAQNYSFYKTTKYGSILRRRLHPLQLNRKIVNESWQINVLGEEISIENNESLSIQIQSTNNTPFEFLFHPYWLMVVSYDDASIRTYKFSLTSASVGLLVNVLSDSTTYPSFLRTTDKHINLIKLDCKPKISCPKQVNYKKERIIWN